MNGLQFPLLPKVVTWATKINTDPNCSRTINPDIILVSPGLVVTLVLGYSEGHSDQ